MKKNNLLREFLRALRRAHLKPTPESWRRLELLRFMGGHTCPICGDEVELSQYSVTRDSDGEIQERYGCPHCGSDFPFPPDPMH